MNFLLTVLPALSRQRQVISGSRPACTQSSMTEKPVSEKKNKRDKEPKERLVKLPQDLYTASL